MDNPRPEKVAVVEEVRARLDGAAAAILTEYRGLSVKDVATLRRSLTAVGGTYKVYKNTLVGFAVRDLGLAELDDMLKGPTAIAFVQGDAVDVARTLRDFARTHPNLVVKGGLLGQRVLSSADAAALAEVAPREVLLARFAGALAAPMVQFAGLLQALPRNLAYGLKALIDQRVAGGEAPPAPAEAAEPEETVAPATGSALPEPDAAPSEGAPGGEPATAAPTTPEPADGDPEVPPADPSATTEPA